MARSSECLDSIAAPVVVFDAASGSEMSFDDVCRASCCNLSSIYSSRSSRVRIVVCGDERVPCVGVELDRRRFLSFLRSDE